MAAKRVEPYIFCILCISTLEGIFYKRRLQIFIIDRPTTLICASKEMYLRQFVAGLFLLTSKRISIVSKCYLEPTYSWTRQLLGWDCGTWHITVQYFFVVREVKQMIDLVGQLTMGNLAHDEGSLVTSPEGTSWVIWFGAMTVIGSRC